jgi:hypothetical protein
MMVHLILFVVCCASVCDCDFPLYVCSMRGAEACSRCSCRAYVCGGGGVLGCRRWLMCGCGCKYHWGGIIDYKAMLPAPGKENTPERGVYFVLYVFVLYFVLYLYFMAPATRDKPRLESRLDLSSELSSIGWSCTVA